MVFLMFVNSDRSEVDGNKNLFIYIMKKIFIQRKMMDAKSEIRLSPILKIGSINALRCVTIGHLYP